MAVWKTRVGRGNTRGSTKRGRWASARGIVTVEFALGLIGAVMVLGLFSGVLGLMIMQGECEDVATQVARQQARGDKAAADRAAQAAPKAAKVSRTTRDGWVVVTVSADRTWGPIGPVTVTGKATMPLEPREKGP